MESSKVFIDTDSEITFVLEKILSAKTNKVVLVIPDRASFLSSIVGLKLIKRIVDKSNKLLVLVTLDEIGANLAKSADLCVVSRVGEINEAIWEKAQKIKFEAIKKGLKSRYTPEVSKNTEEVKEEKQKSLQDLLNLKNEEVTVGEIVDDLESEINNEEVKEVEEVTKEQEYPQVRINLDLNSLNEEKEAEEVISDVIDNSKPQFLSHEEESPTAKELDIKETDKPSNFQPLDLGQEDTSEEIEEKKEETKKIDVQPERIRKVASGVNISNLTFLVGKDIKEKKKTN